MQSLQLTQLLNPLTHLRVHCLLSGGVPAAKPPVHKDPPELHVEDDGVAPEEADLLLQHGSLLSPGHLMTLKALQLQTSTLGFQAQTLVFLWKEGSGTRLSHTKRFNSKQSILMASKKCQHPVTFLNVHL